jgi:hypothetical protein
LLQAQGKTREMISPRTAIRFHYPLAALLTTLLLGGCQTVGGGAIIEDEEVMRIASPTNIASLSDVVRRNPRDPQA